MNDDTLVSNLPSACEAAPARFRLVPSDLVIIDGTGYVPVSFDSAGHILARADERKLLESFTHAQIDDLRSRGSLEIKHNHFAYNQVALTLNKAFANLWDLPEKTRKRVLARKTLCDDFLRAEAAREVTRSDASIKLFVKKRWLASVENAMTSGRHGGKDVAIPRPPGATTVRRFLKAYESSGLKAMALCDDYVRSGNTAQRFSSEIATLMAECARLYLDRKQPSKRTIYLKLLEAIKARNVSRRDRGENLLQVPSRNAFSRVIDKLDSFQVYAARNSVEAAKKKFYIVREGIEVVRPLERIEADGNNIPVQSILEVSGVWDALAPAARDTIERGRWVGSFAIDVATRCIVGFVLVPTATSASAIETVRMIVTDKRELAREAGCATPWDMFGAFETIATDNGSEYANDAFQSAVVGLEAEASYPPAGLPELRAFIERFFGSIHSSLFSRFSGRTFANVVAKGNYDSEQQASLLLDEIWRLITRWIVDVYHNSPHEGLGGETPRAAWLRLTELYPVILPPSADVARHIFGMTVERKIGNHGLRVLGLNYWSKELHDLRRKTGGKAVRVRLDRDDIGHVSVETSPGTWHTVRCAREGFDGVSAHHWITTVKSLRRRHAETARLSEDIVFAALRDIEATIHAAESRCGIGSSLLSRESADAFERDLAKSFEFVRAENGQSPFDDVTPNEPKEPATGSPAAEFNDEVRPTDGQTFFLED